MYQPGSYAAATDMGDVMRIMKSIGTDGEANVFTREWVTDLMEKETTVKDDVIAATRTMCHNILCGAGGAGDAATIPDPLRLLAEWLQLQTEKQNGRVLLEDYFSIGDYVVPDEEEEEQETE